MRVKLEEDNRAVVGEVVRGCPEVFVGSCTVAAFDRLGIEAEFVGAVPVVVFRHVRPAGSALEFLAGDIFTTDVGDKRLEFLGGGEVESFGANGFCVRKYIKAGIPVFQVFRHPDLGANLGELIGFAIAGVGEGF